MNEKLGRNRRGERGNALVEFAIGATVMVSLFTGIFQFGYVFYIYNNLFAAVDNGAKYAAFRTYDSNSTTPSSAFSTAVKNMVVYGQSTAGTSPVVPGLTTGAVNLTVAFDSTGTVPSTMTVSISGYSLYAVVTTLSLNKPAVTYPYMGVFSPL